MNDRPRIASLDIVRGGVMVLMALDHVRVYAGVPAGGADPALFFSRWITNFCAPAFFFCAGIGAFLHSQRLASSRQLAVFLLSRGLWLVVLELTVIRCSWTFDFDFAHYNLAGVIWALGWSMVLLAPLVLLPRVVIASLGLLIVAGHHLLPTAASTSIIWNVLYGGRGINCFGLPVTILYALIPWVGVMAAGHAFGPVMLATPDRRRRLCLLLGGGAVVLFAILRGFELYGDRPWHGSRLPAWLAFFATNKYPASLQFLLMTLGPMLLAMPWLERRSGSVARVLRTYGRVPLFYYLLHIPLIHLVALLCALVVCPNAVGWLNSSQPMVPPPPPEYVWSLPRLYTTTALVVAALYVPCRWFAGVKARRRDWWLSFL